MIHQIELVLNANCHEHKSTITELSAGSATQNETKLFYLSEVEIFNLDKMVKCFGKSTTKSSDALHTYNNKIYFIEFKAGKEKNIEKEDLKLKLFDSINSLYKIVKGFNSAIKREDFFDVRFVYFVVYKADKPEKAEKPQPVLARLQRSVAKWGLSELSDFFIEEAITEFRSEKVIEILSKITNQNKAIYYAS